MPVRETADTVKPHSNAKLQFYIRYLERYLQILLRSRFIEKVNIYDMFCGAGIYSDGNTGSAVRAVDSIWRALSSSKSSTTVNLHLNDLDKAKLEKLKEELASRSSLNSRFSISFSDYEASSLLSRLPSGFSGQARTTRNLVFIDPYGYKAINKSTLEGLLTGSKTEIILFLPVEQMYRFSKKAVSDSDDPSYRPLFNFINQFGIDTSDISSEKQFIKAVERALRFHEKVYTTSYAIKNHNGHYYGIFFITPNVLGLEKILEVKWELDRTAGSEFTGSSQVDILLEMERMSELESEPKRRMDSGDVSNIDLYLHIMNLGFLPRHASDFLGRWQNSGELSVVDVIKNGPARKKSFKLTYQEFKAGSASRIFKFQKSGLG